MSEIKRPKFLREYFQASLPEGKVKKVLVGGWLVIVVLAVYILLSFPDGRLHVYFLDVGQGDSILILTPESHKILIDGGPDGQVLDHLGRILPFYDRGLDLVVLTHSHADHLAGLIEVVKGYKTDLLLVNKTDYQTPETTEFWRVVEEKGIRVEGLRMGEAVEIGKVELDCFWPPKERVETGSNNPNLDSIILRLVYGDFSVLLTGDAESVVQEQLILLERIPPLTTVLKVPHQGAEDCCDEEFIKKLDPELAIISVGPNRFGHPGKKTSGLLENLGIEVLRTDNEGTIEIVSDGEKWWPELN